MGHALLPAWIDDPTTINRIIDGWRVLAIESNNQGSRASTPDEIERQHIDQHRFDPVAMVTAIMNDPVTRDRVRTEMYGPMGHLRNVQRYEKVLIEEGCSKGASELFKRISRALDSPKLGRARLTRARPHYDVALRGWLRPCLEIPLGIGAPPLCVLDSNGIAKSTGLWQKDGSALLPGAIRTAIVKWGLPRPDSKKRVKLPQILDELFSRDIASLASRVLSDLEE